MRTSLESLAANPAAAGPQNISEELVKFYGAADSPYQVNIYNIYVNKNFRKS